MEHLSAPDTSLPFPPPTGGYLTRATAANTAGVSRVAIRKWIHRNPGVAIRPGRDWLILPKPFAAYLRRRAGGGDAQG